MHYLLQILKMINDNNDLSEISILFYRSGTSGNWRRVFSVDMAPRKQKLGIWYLWDDAVGAVWISTHTATRALWPSIRSIWRGFYCSITPVGVENR